MEIKTFSMVLKTEQLAQTTYVLAPRVFWGLGFTSAPQNLPSAYYVHILKFVKSNLNFELGSLHKRTGRRKVPTGVEQTTVRHLQETGANERVHTGLIVPALWSASTTVCLNSKYVRDINLW